MSTPNSSGADNAQSAQGIAITGAPTSPAHRTSVNSLRSNVSTSSGTPIQSPPTLNVSTHRQSKVDGLRSHPPTPRSARHPSLTQAALQDLINQSKSTQRNRQLNPDFASRNWNDVAIGELSLSSEVKWVTMDTTVEDATRELLKTSPVNAVLVRESPHDSVAVSTFDFNDLNAYLLVVVGIAKPDDETAEVFKDLAAKARAGQPLTIRDIQPVCHKESLISISGTEKLNKAIEIFGSGVHRLIVTDTNGNVTGLLDQLRIVEFFWHEGVNFPVIDDTYTLSIQDLRIASKTVIGVSQDRPLSEALLLMYNEGLNSVAIVDANQRVVGNISTVDVKHLTSIANAHLLESTCLSYISVILNERGVDQGRDSFPVFYVSSNSTLSHTIAKLVATHSHRMWVVDSTATESHVQEPPSPGPSGPLPSPSALTGPSLTSTPSVVPGFGQTGKLSGVISLSDILNLFAKTTGLNPADPNEQRARRRRSSSASIRPSFESSRGSLDLR